MKYPVIIFNPDGTTSLTTKVAKNEYRNKRGHGEEHRAAIDAKAEAVVKSGGFNGEKAMFYIAQGSEGTLKVVKEDYASVSAALADKTGLFERQHFVAGVIVVCRTADDKIIIGSRDAARDKADPTKYSLQFPCGFIDVNEEFYKQATTGDVRLLKDAVIGDALREMNEEVIEFPAGKITGATVLGAIGADRKWPKKDGTAKDVRVIKSFVVEVAVGLTYEEISARRMAEVAAVHEALKADPSNPGLLRKAKDFTEMTVMSSIDLAQVPALLFGKTDGTEVEINFEGIDRKFVAEHGEVLDIVAHLRCPKSEAVTVASGAGEPLLREADSKFMYV